MESFQNRFKCPIQVDLVFTFVAPLLSSFKLSFTVTSTIDEEGSSATAGFSKFDFSVFVLEAAVSNPTHSY